MSDLDNASKRLEEAFLVIKRRWQASETLWQDQVQRQFEETYWQPLASLVPATLNDLDQLAQTIAQARNNIK